MSSTPPLERAWQAMRFVTAGMPGPLARPFVKELEALEASVSQTIPLSDAARFVFEADLDRRAQRIVARCILARPSLG